jgi:hypothetical protein
LREGYTRAIRKVTAAELLKIQAMRKKLLYTKNTFILELLLNVVTAGTEALVVSGNHNLLCTDKNKYYMPRYVMVYKAMSHATLSHMRELSPAHTLVD